MIHSHATRRVLDALDGKGTAGAAFAAACPPQVANDMRAVIAELTATVEAFARHRHEATGPDLHNQRNTRPNGDARGASPVGLVTWADAPESWREQYRDRCRQAADEPDLLTALRRSVEAARITPNG